MQRLAGADNALTQTLGRLFALSEAYPDLEANQTMMQLSEELAHGGGGRRGRERRAGGVGAGGRRGTAPGAARGRAPGRHSGRRPARARARPARGDSTPLREAARQPEQAMPLVFALLLNDEPGVRARQLELIGVHCDAGTAGRVGALAAAVATLHPMQRLPLAALAFPARRRRPRPRLATFMVVMRADARVTLAEYCLATLIRIQVIDALDPAAGRLAGRLKLPDVAVELGHLLAIVAKYGHDDRAAAECAYALGLLEVLPQAALDYRPPAEWALALDRALPKLDRLAPGGKELVVRALTRSISVHGVVVSVAEAELLRTVCGALHCPLQPLLAGDSPVR